MRIIGIDPGLAIVGWGVIDSVRGNVTPVAYGAITTPAHTPIEQRLCMIEADLRALIEKYKPEEMAVEELFFTNNITTGIAVAEARGVILCTANRLGVKIAEYTPPQVKQAVVGYGKADISPENPVPLSGYGDELERISITVETLQLWAEKMLANGIINAEQYNARKSK